MSQHTRRRRLEVEDMGDISIVNFMDQKILDEMTTQDIGEDLYRLVDELGRRKLILNFAVVEFMTSAMLGKLITLNRKLQAVNGKLILCSINPKILEIFHITRAPLTILADVQTALQAF